FNTEKIQLNGLKLSTKGFVQIPDSNNMLLDVQFNTPSNDFKDILSLVPAIYQNNFKDIKTTGKATLSGKLLGSMNKNHLPTFHINLAVDNGSFQYPDLPEKVNNIQIRLKVDNADGLPDHTIVNLEKGHIELGTEPFDCALLLKTPITNQWIDATMKGKIDLSKMQKIIKLEPGTKLTGNIDANVSVKGYVAAAQKQQFDKLDAAGTIGIAGLNYASKDYPDGVSVNSLQLTFTPKNVTVANLKGKYLETTFTGDGYINNLLGFYLHSEPLQGMLHFTADQLNVTRFMTATSDKPTSKADTPASVFLVPDNLDITLKAEVGQVIYDKLTLSGVSGAVLVRNQVVNMQNITGSGLDGTIKINGYYGTKTDKKNPDIQFDYDVKGIDIAKTYNTFTTIQKMFPAGKYATGKVSSSLTMTGKLGGDMMPQMNTLNGKGEASLLGGTLGNFPVTDALASKLGVNQFKSIPLNDLRLFFHFENGRLSVDPYKVTFNQIEMEIAGSHGFDQSLQYGVNITLPTSLLGSQGSAMVNNLISQAASKGITVKAGDKVNLTATITGLLMSPKIETNLKSMVGNAVADMKKQLEEEARRRADSIKNVAKDSVKSAANQLVNAAKDDLKKQLLGDTTKKQTTDEVIKNTTDKVKNGINNLFNKKR
ncbi:MAG: hypothetical protein EBZ77_10540, partial [Chitinophagia bacterium]|nr:hypothetical protein [Chitinophagia bacterium]